MSMNKLNREEMFIGASVGLSLMDYMGWWSVLGIPLCSLFWAMGGAGYKKVRRLGVPCVIGFLSLMNLEYFRALLVIPSMFGVLTIGYGIPDINDPEGSWLGNKIYKIVKNGLIANIIVKFIYGCMLIASCVPLFFIKWNGWVLNLPVLMVIVVLIMEVVRMQER